MSIDSMLNQTCDIFPGTMGRNGKRSYSITPLYDDEPCRSESKRREIKGPDGTTVTTDTVIFLKPTVTIKRGYKVTVDSIDYHTVHVDRMQGLSALHHYELLCNEIV